MYPYQIENEKRQIAQMIVQSGKLGKLASFINHCQPDKLDLEAEKEGAFLSGTLTRYAYCPIRKHFVR